MTIITKEFLYVGYYMDINGNFILKVGTTKDLNRRRNEHNRSYRNAKNYQMHPMSEFEYLWTLPLSKYNTIRYEDRTRDMWKEMGFGEFIRNDRFLLVNKPNFIPVKIRKTYQIPLFWGEFFCIKCLLTNVRHYGIIGRAADASQGPFSRPVYHMQIFQDF